MKRVKDLLNITLKKEVLESWETKLVSVYDHTNHNTGEVDGKTIVLAISRDKFSGYTVPEVSNFNASVMVHDIGANDSTYANFKAEDICAIEVDDVQLRCAAFFDKKRERYLGYISEFEVYGKVKKAAK